MSIHGVDHVNIRTKDLDRCVAFYSTVLGFRRGERPPFDSPGAWLYSGGEPLVHISVMGRQPGRSTGAIDHVAFAAKGYAATKRRLERAGIPYRLFQVPERPTKQIFVEDPDGIVVELNFRDGR